MDDLTKKAVDRLLERRMTAKYPGRCPECGDYIEVGDEIVWEPGEKARHAACVEPETDEPEEESGEAADTDEPETTAPLPVAFPKKNEPKRVDHDNPQDVLDAVLREGGWGALIILRSGEAIVSGHHQDGGWDHCDSWVYRGAAAEDIAKIAKPSPTYDYTIRCVRCRKRWEGRGWLSDRPRWVADDGNEQPLCVHVTNAKPGNFPLTIRQEWGAYDESGSRILCGSRAIQRLISF